MVASGAIKEPYTFGSILPTTPLDCISFMGVLINSTIVYLVEIFL